MSDLNREIDVWRHQLEQSGSISADDIAELESHLLEELESLQKSGLRPDEALIIATRRLGHPHELAVEYAKNDALMSWKRPAKLVLWGMLVLKLLSLGWGVFYTSLTYWDPRIFTDSQLQGFWVRNIYWMSLLTQAAVLGLFWSLAENPQGRIARSLTWLEQSVKTTHGAFYLILASVVLDLFHAATRLFQLWILSRDLEVRNGIATPFHLNFNMISQAILADMSWSVPVVVLLVVLIRTEVSKRLARLSTR